MTAAEAEALRRRVEALEAQVCQVKFGRRDPWDRDKAAAHLDAFMKSYRTPASAPPEPDDYRTTMRFVEQESCGRLRAEVLIRSWASDEEWRSFWDVTPQARWTRLARAAGSAGDVSHPLNYAKGVLRRLASENPQMVREPKMLCEQELPPVTRKEAEFWEMRDRNFDLAEQRAHDSEVAARARRPRPEPWDEV